MPVLRRPLAPGQYVVIASHPGMANASVAVTVPLDGSGAVIAFQLAPADSTSKVCTLRMLRAESPQALLFVPHSAGVTATGLQACAEASVRLVCARSPAMVHVAGFLGILLLFGPASAHSRHQGSRKLTVLVPITLTAVQC